MQYATCYKTVQRHVYKRSSHKIEHSSMFVRVGHVLQFNKNRS